MTLRYMSLLLICLPLAACSSKEVVPQHSAEQYFQQGESYFESNLYDDAIASWEKVRDTYYSPELNMLAELKIAEAYFFAGRYDDAATAYADFLEQHPNDPRTAEILYRLGISHYRQILAADRDQTTTQKAISVFQELLQRFPKDRSAEEVGYLIQRCRNRLAEHEVYVGRFYLRTEAYQPSINRLESVLATFPNYYYRDAAYFYLGQAYLKIGELDKSKAAFNKLFEEFPGSEFIIEAQEILAKEY